MHQLFPLALRKLLPRTVRSTLIRFCKYFKELCSKVLEPRDLAKLETEIAETLCQLERIFLPTFFDVMVHLTIHLATKARIGGLIQYRWMYPIERYTLKLFLYSKSILYYFLTKGFIIIVVNILGTCPNSSPMFEIGVDQRDALQKDI